MNHNFLGQPMREDTQTLDQLRRQLMPMIGLLDKLQNDMVFKLNRGEVVDWPHIRHTISVINSYLTSINAYINGSYRHTAEEAGKDTAGNVILDEDKNPKMIYRDHANPGQAERLGSLHAFPQAPFPMLNERLAGMALVLLEKRLGPTEEKWVQERVRKAAQFAYVPGEWGVEPRKAEEAAASKGHATNHDDKDNDDDEEDGIKGWDEGIPTKRVKGTLSEDEIMEVWAKAHRTAFDKQYARKMRFSEGLAEMGEEDKEAERRKGGAVEEAEEEDEGDGDEEMEYDEDEEEEEEEEDDNAKPPPPAPVVMIQKAPASIHKAVAGTPIMPLEFVHRFMTSGEVQASAGQR